MGLLNKRPYVHALLSPVQGVGLEFWTKGLAQTPTVGDFCIKDLGGRCLCGVLDGTFE
jgi:hypothetical protein